MGKTSMTEEMLASLFGWHERDGLETLIASQCDPTEFLGLDVPDGNGGTSKAPPDWAKRLAARGQGCLFLDEVSGAMPAVQAALLRVVHKRVVGTLALPSEVLIVAASNPPEEAAGGWEQAPAMANRWTHLVSLPEDRKSEDWIAWLLRGESAVTSVPKIDLPRWHGEYEVTKKLAAMFIERRPGALEETQKDYRGRVPLAFATRRSWENVVRLHATCRAVGREDLLLDFAAGSIGEPMALQYATWVREIDLPDPKRLLLNPEEFTPDPKRPDRDYATMLAVVAVATEGITSRDTEVSKAVRDQWFAAWRVIDRGMAAGKELVAGAAQGLGERRPRGGLTDPSVRAIIAKLAPVLSSAGVRAA